MKEPHATKSSSSTSDPYPPMKVRGLSTSMAPGDTTTSSNCMHRLLRREEVLELCCFLPPQDLANLMCTERWRPKDNDRRAIWQTYFMLRWGAEHGVKIGTKLHVMHSWVDDGWPAAWPLAVGFCGAWSAMDHAFWFLPFARVLGARLIPRHQPLPTEFGWHLAAVVRSKAEASGNSLYASASRGRMARCFICDTLEVAPPGPAPQHFRQRWARPCSCKALLFAHRTCLEQKLRAAINCGSFTSLAPEGTVDLRCDVCKLGYVASSRFPETLAELVWATFLEWRWLFRRVLVMMLFFVWMYTLALHYCIPLQGVVADGSSLSLELGFLLLVTACLMSITMSQRFHCSVQLIWNTPHRQQYFKLFALFAALFYAVCFRAIDPRLWEAAAAERPWLISFHELHVMAHSSHIGSFFLTGISMLYVITATGVIFLFWKTSLRVPTIADIGPSKSEGGDTTSVIIPPSHEGDSACGLCQLGLCLDNTFM